MEDNRVTNFRELLANSRIEVPCIQRNYVHGDDDSHAKEVREHFVDEIIELIKNSEAHFKLDFIYGMGNTSDAFVPVDGQQRLTTLWLIAVYAVHVFAPEAERPMRLAELSKFAYSGRTAAESFARMLTSTVENFKLLGDFDPNVFDQAWRNDPTVRGMCRTLQTIDGKLKTIKTSWQEVANALERVEFHLELIEDLKCSPDDLYLKINARGKTLTQWENFKGRFSRSLKGEQKKDFDAKIEDFANSYFLWAQKKNEVDAKEKVPVLPDDCFFALFGRIVEYWLQTRKEASCSVGEHLAALAKADPRKKLPYVPADEFMLSMSAPETTTSLLFVIKWGLDNAQEQFPYWDDRTIGQALFTPRNENERDLSLILFEYFTKYDLEEQQLSANGYRAVRLIANVFENEGREDRFSRVDGLAKFLDSSDLYGTSCDEAQFKCASQYWEELLKAKVYANPDNVALLQEAERLMHGRVRLAIGDLSKDDLILNLDKFKVRSTTLIEILKQWEEATDRRNILLARIIRNIYWGVPGDISIQISLDDDECRNLLSNKLDSWAQKSLIDHIEDPQNWYSKTTAANCGFGEYARDWRESVADFVVGKLKLPGVQPETKNLRVKWHVSGAYYLYTKTNNPGSFPVGDYRIDFFRDPASEFHCVLKKIGIDAMIMNYTGECFLAKDKTKIPGVEFEFWKNGCSLRYVKSEGRTEAKFIHERDIKRIGWRTFIERIEKFVEGKDVIEKWRDEDGWNRLLNVSTIKTSEQEGCAEQINVKAFGRYLDEMQPLNIDVGGHVEIQINSDNDACVEGKWVGRYFVLKNGGETQFHGWFGCRYGGEFYVAENGWVSCNEHPVFVVQIKKDDCHDLLERGLLRDWYAGEGKRGCEYESLWQNHIVSVNGCGWDAFPVGLVASLRQLLGL